MIGQDCAPARRMGRPPLRSAIGGGRNIGTRSSAGSHDFVSRPSDDILNRARSPALSSPSGGFFNRNTATSVVIVEVFAFPIRNITLIRRAKATCEAILSARAIARLVCGELSDSDPPACFSVAASSAVPSVAFLSSSVIALTMSDRRYKLGTGDAKGAAVLLWHGGSLLRRLAQGEDMIGDAGKRDAALRVAT
jgi:hypothetical protein